jgi:pSer/pThr/pTyr-binding forkhead associated (FHA) protein
MDVACAGCGPILARVSASTVPAETARELKARLEAERRGSPFLVYRDAEGRQLIRELDGGRERLTVGRSQAAEVSLEFDPEVSRVHAELERLGDDWTLADDGLSRNGSFVNNERIVGRRRLRDGDALRFGDTLVLFRSPAQARDEETVAATDRPDVSRVTDTQRRVLMALCRPFREGNEFASPATNKQVADEVFLSVDAVKANLRALFETFEIGDLPQNQKRIRLAELALRSGVISPRDLES